MNMRERERDWEAWWVREMKIYIYICIYVFIYIYMYMYSVALAAYMQCTHPNTGGRVCA